MQTTNHVNHKFSEFIISRFPICMDFAARQFPLIKKVLTNKIVFSDSVCIPSSFDFSFHDRKKKDRINRNKNKTMNTTIAAINNTDKYCYYKY